MVMKVMQWPHRPSVSKKFQVNLALNRLEGVSIVQGSSELSETKLHVDVKWKGPKGALGSRFRSMKRVKTTAVSLGSGGKVVWEEEFESICVLTTGKTGTFQPWHVYLVLCKAVQDGAKSKLSVAGTAVLDVGLLAPIGGNNKQSVSVPLRCNMGGSELEATFWVTLSFVELRTMHQAGFESVHRFMAPAMACIGDPRAWEAEDHAERIIHVVAGKKEKTSKELSREQVLGWGGRKSPQVEDSDVTDDGKFSPRSDESLQDASDLFDSDFAFDFDVEDYEDEVEDDHCERSLSYGTLVGVNLVVEGALPHDRDAEENETDKNLTIHSRSKSTSPPQVAASSEEFSISESGELVPQGSLLRMLSWRKRKLNYRSTRSRGEPLLNKAYGEEGGDEIDWDRRQSSPSYQPELTRQKSEHKSLAVVAGLLDFGEELFTVGSWERKDFVSRDGQTKLSAEVFFASLDQRSASAAGESACTALVAVIADWLHKHPTLMPSKAEFDMLIRDGSAEWRNMCSIEAYKGRFPDQHFDLDTVIEAAIRPLSVVSEKSFIGFFQPEGVSDSCNFLQDAMSFDSIWEEVERAGPAIYIVSWNDHFFVLKVEDEGCYIIDTLGERLSEGGSQAYILRFDAETSLHRSPVMESLPQAEPQTKVEAVSPESLAIVEVCKEGDEKTSECEAAPLDGVSSEVVLPTDLTYIGRSACCQFVKEFFAALPLRELQSDIEKGLLGKVPLHQRLQIEFHFTKS
ncbi:hypothetical protein CY35_09G042600 [Sphagnum magellanicum]|nr:hypothetical protein CY35_09G042600 [Sphagnum magellanicum]KAH9552010.1 hypothetical protein CY35_09G042600 [Sphagnum magellanicum]